MPWSGGRWLTIAQTLIACWGGCLGQLVLSWGVTCASILLDGYVEAELAGADAHARVPGMNAHLQGCPACAEEHESLRELLSFPS